MWSRSLGDVLDAVDLLLDELVPVAGKREVVDRELGAREAVEDRAHQLLRRAARAFARTSCLGVGVAGVVPLPGRGRDAARLAGRAPGRRRSRRSRAASRPRRGRRTFGSTTCDQPASSNQSVERRRRVVVVGERRRRGTASSRAPAARSTISRVAQRALELVVARRSRPASGSPVKSCVPPRSRRRPVMQTKPSTPRSFQVVELGVGERGDVFARRAQKISRSAASPASPAGFGRSAEAADPDSSAPLGASNHTATAASPSSAPAAAMYLSLSIPTTPHVADPATRRHQAPGSSREGPPNRRPASPTA